MTGWEKFCEFVLCKVMGWTIVDGPAPEDKCILLGVPHTSIWDFLVSYLYYRSRGEKAKCMVKKELFFPFYRPPKISLSSGHDPVHWRSHNRL